MTSLQMGITLLCILVFFSLHFALYAQGNTCDDHIRYIGCFGDYTDRTRVLPENFISSNAMTVEMCMDHCRESNQYRYAGLEYRLQCFCGNADADYTRLGTLGEDRCQLTCAGDVTSLCGGSNAIAVYDLDLIICERSSTDIDCGEDTINICTANYGRTDTNTCGQFSTTDCILDVTTQLQLLCNGQTQCTISSSNIIAGDPCVGIEKYLDITYDCGAHQQMTTQEKTTTQPTTTVHEQSTTQPTTTAEEQTTTQPTTTAEEQTTTQPTTTVQELTTTQPTTTVEEQTTTQLTTTVQEQTTTQPTTTVQEQTITQPTTTVQEHITTQPVTTAQEQTTTQPTTTAKEQTTTQPTTTAEEQTTSRTSTTRQHQTTNGQTNTIMQTELITTIQSKSRMRSARYKVLASNAALIGSASTHEATSFIKCSQLCLSDDLCKRFTYIAHNGACLLSHIANSSLQPHHGAVTYSS